jgi:mono/diheme cytochrome c family protein
MIRKFTASALISAGTLAPALAQDIALSFTNEQADAGRALYDSGCAQCHGANLDDGALGSPLKGPQFMQAYGGRNAAELFDITRSTMPQVSPGSLSAAEYASLVAFMLRENSIVPGDTPLPTA